jgi:DNA-binding CsgD family transcriptional regulator
MSAAIGHPSATMLSRAAQLWHSCDRQHPAGTASGAPRKKILIFAIQAPSVAGILERLSMPQLSLDDLMSASVRLGEAVVDPAAWPSVMEDLSRAIRAEGAALLQSDVRTPDVPRTAAISDMINDYFRYGWHERDVRAARGVPLVLSGQSVVIDQDILSPDEMRKDAFYNECTVPHGLQWWAVIGFWAGTAHWGLAFQRTIKQGPFEPKDRRVLVQISRRLSEAASLSKAVSRSVLAGTTNALNLVRQPAVIVDRLGFVLDTNAAAEGLFDSEIRVHNRRLCISHKHARAELERFVDAIRVAADTEPLPAGPIVVRRQAKPPILIRILPIEAAARSPFLGARALLMLVDLGERRVPHSGLLAKVFGLTVAEAKLASLIGAGESIERAAECLRISPLTARGQLKAVFSKTDTHRQAELAALLSRLQSFPTE